MKTQIKRDIMVAMKSGNTIKRDILRVLMGEIERNEQTSKGKFELSNEAILGLVKKMVTNIKETNGDNEEVIFLSEYLPTMLSSESVDEIISAALEKYSIDSMKGMGIIMKEFSTVYPNQYDGKAVAMRIREKLINK